MTAELEYDLFISFNSVDRAFALEFDAFLRRLGLRTFYDRRELIPGLPWIVALEDAITRSRAMAVLIGSRGLGNVQQYERDLALVRQSEHASFPIVPVLIPGCDAPPAGFLAIWTWLDLRGGVHADGAVERLRSAIGIGAGDLRRPEPMCPFMGLEPFREEDAPLFCGRDKAIAELTASVSERRLVAVVGRSGSGKSSLIFAGLLPHLRRQRPAVVWDAISIRPGQWPLRALAAAFRVEPAPIDPLEWVRAMELGAGNLREAAGDVLTSLVARWLDVAPGKPDKLLLYVDQWEELYSMAPSEGGEAKEQHAADVDRFIALLLQLASDPRSRACVVLTVRADFYGSLMSHPDLGALMPSHQVNIGAMSREDLRSAIERPAQRAALSFEPPSLVDDILDDAGTDEAVLPLLQYALKETWAHLRDGRLLTAEGYRKAGGVLGAIQTTADRTYEALDEREKAAARRLFLGLVNPGEGREDTRALMAMPNDPMTLAVIAKFTDRRARLLVTGSVALPNKRDAELCVGNSQPAGSLRVQGTLEVAHEALIRNWPELRGWLAANRDTLRTRAGIVQQQKEWESNGRRPDLLLASGFQLERGRALLREEGDVPVDDIREYVDLSERKEEERLAVQRRAHRREKTRLRYMTIGAIALALIFGTLALYASNRAQVAKRATARAKEAESASNESLATALYQKGRAAEELAHWGAATMYFAAARLKHDTPEARWAAALAEARSIVAASLYTGHQADVNATAIASDGQRVVSVDSSGGVRVWSLSDGRTLAAAKLEHGLWSAAFSPNADELAVGDETGVIYRFTPSLAPLGELHGHLKQVWSLAYSPDGTQLASGSEDSTIRLWPRGGGQSKVLRGHKQRVYSVAFSLDGDELASGSDDREMWRWNAETGVGASGGTSPNGGIRTVAYLGSSVVGGSWGAAIRVWDAGSKGTSSSWEDNNNVHALAITPDRRVIVSAGDGGDVDFWDATTHLRVASVEAPNGRTSALAVSGDGHWLVCGGQSKQLLVWDLSALPRLVSGVGHTQWVDRVAVSADLKKVVSAGWDRTIRVWDATSGAELRAVSTGDAQCNNFATILRDDSIVASCDDSSVRRWFANGKNTRQQTQIWMKYASLSSDERVLTGGHLGGQAQSLDLASGKLGPVRILHSHHIYGFSSCATGQILTVSLDGTAKLWTQDLEPLAVFKADTRDGLLAGVLSPDCAIAVSGSEDSFIEAWTVHPQRHMGRVHSLAGMIGAVAYGAGLIYTTGQSGVLEGWDPKIWRRFRSYDAAEGAANGLAVAEDGSLLLTGHQSGAVVSWDPVTGRPRWRTGGHSREHGSCENFSAQTWVDTSHRNLVEAACRAEPAAYFAAFAKRSHQRIERGIDVKMNFSDDRAILSAALPASAASALLPSAAAH